MGSRTRSAQKRLGGTAKEKFKTNPKSKPNQKKIYTKFPKNTQIFVPFLICILLSIYSNHTPNTYSSKHTISFTQIDKTKISNKNQKPKTKTKTKHQTGNSLVLLWICVRFHRCYTTLVFVFSCLISYLTCFFFDLILYNIIIHTFKCTQNTRTNQTRNNTVVFVNYLNCVDVFRFEMWYIFSHPIFVMKHF